MQWSITDTWNDPAVVGVRRELGRRRGPLDGTEDIAWNLRGGPPRLLSERLIESERPAHVRCELAFVAAEEPTSTEEPP
jgi:hypothetical protein